MRLKKSPNGPVATSELHVPNGGGEQTPPLFFARSAAARSERLHSAASARGLKKFSTAVLVFANLIARSAVHRIATNLRPFRLHIDCHRVRLSGELLRGLGVRKLPPIAARWIAADTRRTSQFAAAQKFSEKFLVWRRNDEPVLEDAGAGRVDGLLLGLRLLQLLRPQGPGRVRRPGPRLSARGGRPLCCADRDWLRAGDWLVVCLYKKVGELKQHSRCS